MEPGFVGAIGEAISAVEFVRAGCSVFTPLVDAGSSAVDYVVEISGRLYRVQVKCVKVDVDEPVTCETKQRYDDDAFDLLCFVVLSKTSNKALPKLYLMKWPFKNKYSITLNAERQIEYDFYRQINYLSQ